MATNPILQLRHERGYTQQALANLLGISPQTIRRAEQGTFVTVPSAFRNLWGLDFQTLQKQYEAWRTASRQELAKELNEDLALTPLPLSSLTNIPNLDQSTHPFNIFRRRLMTNAYLKRLTSANPGSMVGFCKLVHLDPKAVEAFESSYQLTVPATIEVALNDLGFGTLWLTAALKNYRSAHGL